MSLHRQHEWIQKTPKVELHRHLQGSIRTSTMLDIGRRYNIPLPANGESDLDRFIKFEKPAKNLLEFLQPWRLFSRITVDSDVISRITYEAIEDSSSDNIEYLELRFAPYTMSGNMKLDPIEILEAVTKGIKKAKSQFPIIVKLILGIDRVDLTNYFKYNVRILEAAQDYRDFVVGFDLTGNEAGFPPRLYAEFFRLVRMRGFKVTIHAGEAADSRSVREAIELLGANRIGHGVRALEDKDVVRLLTHPPQQRSPIPVEICPTSTYLTGTLPKNRVILSIRQFLDYGVPVTIGADNPQVCNTTLSNELEWLLSSQSISPDETFGILRNAIDYSFGTQKIKKRLHNSLSDAIRKGKLL